MGLSIIWVIAAYTFILQSAYTKTALETEISRDRASADAVHKLVDGLNPDAGDVRHPGDYIEDEMIPYIERALSLGKTCILKILWTQPGDQFSRPAIQYVQIWMERERS